MATVDKKIADDIIAGKYYDDDEEVLRIVKYTNAWGGEAYGVTFEGESPYKYLTESAYIIDPVVYWDNPKAGKR